MFGREAMLIKFVPPVIKLVATMFVMVLLTATWSVELVIDKVLKPDAGVPAVLVRINEALVSMMALLPPPAMMVLARTVPPMTFKLPREIFVPP